MLPADIESRYRADFDAHAAATTRRSALLVLVIIIAFAGLDLWALPVTHVRAWIVRATLQGVPALLLACYARHAVLAARIQYLLALSFICGGTGTLLICAMAQPGEWGFYLYPYALAQVLALAYNGGRLRLPYAMATGGFFLCGHVVTALWAQHILRLPQGAIAFVLPQLFLLAINLIGAVSLRNTERLLRRDQLQRLLIERERARVDALLRDMLPESVCDRLKRGEVVADAVPEASVLFADITRFTEMAATRPATDVVVLLDRLFSRFDALAGRHGVEKIKTIGDAYMAATGVPALRRDHTRSLARLALDMRHVVSEMRVEYPWLDLRIGIATGPVVAGVIGRSRRLYDLWGDTVNFASRLESHGIPGEIQVDARTHELLGEGFACRLRGVVNLKGRGACLTYLLDAERRSVP